MSNKTIDPFGKWDLPGMAAKAGYALKYKFPFNATNYPGYENRKGIGKNAAKRFPCEDAYTFAFAHEAYWKNKAPILQGNNGLEESKESEDNLIVDDQVNGKLKEQSTIIERNNGEK